MINDINDPLSAVSGRQAEEIEKGDGLTSPAIKSIEAASRSSFDIINQVFQHRLGQSDIDRILSSLSANDRDTFVVKIGDMLKRVSALMNVYNQVSNILSLDLLLHRLIEIITEALNADRGTLFLLDSETGELFSRVAQGDDVTEIRFPSDKGIAGSVFTEGKNVIINDAYSDSRFNPEVDKKTGYCTRNILCSTIKNHQGEIIGVSQVLNKASDAFNEDDLGMLEAITSQAASALENARLHEKVEKARREEEQMIELTQAISTELQLGPLLKKIMQVSTQILEADRSTLFLYDSKTHELWSQVAEGVMVKEIRFPAHMGIAGTVFTTQETINIPDAYCDNRFNQAVDKKTGYRTKSILCMPITNKYGEALGVTQILNKKGGPFTLDDERLLRGFTAQAAIALENAKLFEDVLNAKNYNESILKSLSNGVITLNRDNCITKINHSLLQILQVDDAEVFLMKNIQEIITEESSWILDSISKVKKTGRTDLSVDTEIQFKAVQALSVNLSVVPLIDIKNETIGSMLIIEDISNEKRIKGTMSRYMNKDLVDKVLSEGEGALEGTEQEVTILFSDIRSFTNFSEKAGARGTVKMLNSYFTEMVDVIFQYHGILDKYIGDAIMANFGVPFKSAEDPDNAVKVAVEMIQRLKAYNLRRLEAGEEAIDIGIGVNTGEVVAGNIGSEKRMDYSVIGDGVNLASRLEGATKYYGAKILISEYTHKLLKGKYISRRLDLIRVKGKEQPVGIYEILDYHDEITFPFMKETLALFSKGYALYLEREWSDALEFFKKAVDYNFEDHASLLYIERCQFYSENPPKADWAGVWTMTSK